MVACSNFFDLLCERKAVFWSNCRCKYCAATSHASQTPANQKTQPDFRGAISLREFAMASFDPSPLLHVADDAIFFEHIDKSIHNLFVLSLLRFEKVNYYYFVTVFWIKFILTRSKVSWHDRLDSVCFEPKGGLRKLLRFFMKRFSSSLLEKCSHRRVFFLLFSGVHNQSVNLLDFYDTK